MHLSQWNQKNSQQKFAKHSRCYIPGKKCSITNITVFERSLFFVVINITYVCFKVFTAFLSESVAYSLNDN